VVKGFYSAPVEQIYTLEASSTDHRKEPTSAQPEKLLSYKQVSAVQLLDFTKTIHHYFYKHKNPSGINLHENPLLTEPKGHHESLIWDPVLRHFNTVNILIHHFSKIYFNIITPFSMMASYRNRHNYHHSFNSLTLPVTKEQITMKKIT
jgi:hypothetical protein